MEVWHIERNTRIESGVLIFRTLYFNFVFKASNFFFFGPFSSCSTFDWISRAGLSWEVLAAVTVNSPELDPGRNPLIPKLSSHL
jgi:hypothetical protein